MRKRKLSRQIGVMFSEEIYRKLVKVTDRKEISLSEFIRKIVEKELTKPIRGDMKMNNEIGNKKKVNEIVNHLTNKKLAAEFLNKNEIAEVESVDHVDVYEAGDGRKGLIIEIKEKNNDVPIKVMIDIKSGQPFIGQVYDAIYKNGKDCSKRIIMFGGYDESKTIDPATDECVVGSLITSMNKYPLNLYLSEISDDQLPAQLYDMEIFGGAETRPNFSISDLPSKEKFREAEFWLVYYDSLNTSFYRTWQTFDRSITKKSEYGWLYTSGPLDVEVKWTNEGAFFYITQIKGNNDILKEFLQRKEGELRALFQGHDLQFVYLPGKFPKLVIKFWDFPLNCLMNASWTEKMNYAESLHKYYYRLVIFMDIEF